MKGKRTGGSSMGSFQYGSTPSRMCSLNLCRFSIGGANGESASFASTSTPRPSSASMRTRPVTTAFPEASRRNAVPGIILISHPEFPGVPFGTASVSGTTTPFHRRTTTVRPVHEA